MPRKRCQVGVVARTKNLEVLVLHEVQQELPIPDGVSNLSESLVP